MAEYEVKQTAVSQILADGRHNSAVLRSFVMCAAATS